MRRTIVNLYLILFSITPFLFYPSTSELFELPKMAFIYLLTIFIVSLWAMRIITNKKVYFQRSPLDLPIIFFLGTQILSTLFSIDTLTSLQGYYSRFYGGLGSLIAMSLLFWAAISNIHKKEVPKLLSGLVISAFIISIIAILEHFGFGLTCIFVNGKIDTSCWAQQVQERPYATFGQPNWLAAFLAMILPFTWAKSKNKPYFLAAVVIFIAVLFTKSLSGLLGVGLSFVTFFVITRKIKLGFTIAALYLLLTLSYSPFSARTPENPDPTVTSSSDIRLLLWRGALETWKINPILGTGPETFAMTYYQVRPVEHNNTSEWNFVYNKAHNEYLNYLSNTGFLGFSGYILLVLTIIKILHKRNIALLAGIISLLVSNFFSFSVVVTGTLFFLYPALSLTGSYKKKSFILNPILKPLIIIIVLLVSTVSLLSLIRFLVADINFSREDYQSVEYSVKLSDYQAEYWAKLGNIYAKSGSDYLADSALQKVIDISPRNIKLIKSVANSYLIIGEIDNQYYLKAIDILEQISAYAPTDPIIPYTQALGLIKLGENDEAISKIETALELKPDYPRALDAIKLIEAKTDIISP